MNKIILFLILLVFGIGSCKKNDSTLIENQLDLSGTWSLYNSGTEGNGQPPSVYNATTFPCLLDNKLNFNSDGTYSENFVGTETCYVYRTPSRSISIGIPGTPVINGIFTRNGNSINITDSYSSSVGKISLNNGIPEIDFIYTPSYTNTVYTSKFRK